MDNCVGETPADARSGDDRPANGPAGQRARGAGLGDTSRQFELLVNSVTDYAIYMLDPEGHVRSWNPGGERIKGYAAEDVIGSHVSRFYVAEDIADGLPDRNLETARVHGRYAGEGWRVRKDGGRFRASVVIDPIWQGGELLGFAKITRDVTERYENEQRLEFARHALLEAQKMEAIGKLTLGLAHDFNNLLTVVINSLDAIGQRVQDPRVERLVETALRASDRGILLTRQLLTFGSGQALASERVDVNALVDETHELHRRCAGDGIVVERVLHPALPGIDVDRAQLEAALLNLVSNSRDAMPDGGTITISTAIVRTRMPDRPDSLRSDFVQVSVSDTGSGIPPELQSRVFEPFFTTKDVGRGSGLGLSQVFGFASHSGGFATLDSAPDRGTRVNIHLPVAEAC